MKNIISKSEGEFKQLINIELSNEQLGIISPKSTSTLEEKKEVFEYINNNNKIDLSVEDLSIITTLYNSIKPEISEKDIYEFISMDVSLKGTITKGILNYRLNDEHKQIRF